MKERHFFLHGILLQLPQLREDALIHLLQLQPVLLSPVLYGYHEIQSGPQTLLVTRASLIHLVKFAKSLGTIQQGNPDLFKLPPLLHRYLTYTSGFPFDPTRPLLLEDV